MGYIPLHSPRPQIWQVPPFQDPGIPIDLGKAWQYHVSFIFDTNRKQWEMSKTITCQALHLASDDDDDDDDDGGDDDDE